MICGRFSLGRVLCGSGVVELGCVLVCWLLVLCSVWLAWFGCQVV